MRPTTLAIKRWTLPMLVFLAGTPTALADDPPGRPGKFTPQLMRLVEEAQTATEREPNSWDLFLGVVDLSSSLSRDFHGGSVPQAAHRAPDGWPQDSSWPVDPSEIYAPNVRPIVADAIRQMIDAQERAGVFTLLDQLSVRKRFVRPLPEGKLVEIQLPELGKARSLARLCAARLMLAADAGDQDECVRAFTHGLVLSRPIAHQVTLIDHLVSIAIQALMLDRASDLALAGKLSPSVIRGMLSAIERESFVPDPLLAIQGERLSFKDSVEWTHTDDGEGDGRIIDDQMRKLTNGGGTDGPTLIERVLAGRPGKKETLAQADEFYATMLGYGAMGYRERLAQPPMETLIDQLPKNQVTLRTMVPALDKALASYDRLRMQRAAVKLTLAVMLHEREYGEYPASLAKLRSITLAELDIDPVLLAELRYRAIPTQPGRAAGFTLYALGYDGQDDGGTPPEGDAYKALRPAHSGTDFIYAPRAASK
jgi:hypothetical protein